MAGATAPSIPSGGGGAVHGSTFDGTLGVCTISGMFDIGTIFGMFDNLPDTLSGSRDAHYALGSPPCGASDCAAKPKPTARLAQ